MYFSLKETYALHRELWQRMIYEVETNGIRKGKYHFVSDLKLKCLREMGFDQMHDDDYIQASCFLCQYYALDIGERGCGDCPLRHNECGLYFKCEEAYSAGDCELTLYYMEIIKGIAPTSYSERKELGIA